MCLRAHAIDPRALKTKVDNVISEHAFKEIVYGAHCFNFILSTMRVYPVTNIENNVKLTYAGNWIYDKPTFEKLIETYENSTPITLPVVSPE